jgi:hypothetical protein
MQDQQQDVEEMKANWILCRDLGLVVPEERLRIAILQHIYSSPRSHTNSAY